jgi:gamma-butyrobetaine dioxygenase
MLRGAHPEYFDILSTAPVPFQYINDGHHRHAEHPTIELSSIPSLGESRSSIKYINYAPPFQAPLLLNRTPQGFYTALKTYADLLELPENRFEYTLQEGDAVLFDNRRVLHARTAFSELPEGERHLMGADGETNRWLKGCYLEEDDLLDRVRVLTR